MHAFQAGGVANQGGAAELLNSLILHQLIILYIFLFEPP